MPPRLGLEVGYNADRSRGLATKPTSCVTSTVPGLGIAQVRLIRMGWHTLERVQRG